MTVIKPLGNRVLIKRKESVQSKGGILLPDSAKEQPREGVVVAVGPGSKEEEMQLKEGDHVLFGPYAGTEVGEKDHLIMKQEDVFGVLTVK